MKNEKMIKPAVNSNRIDNGMLTIKDWNTHYLKGNAGLLYNTTNNTIEIESDFADNSITLCKGLFGMILSQPMKQEEGIWLVLIMVNGLPMYMAYDTRDEAREFIRTFKKRFPDDKVVATPEVNG